MKITDLSIKRPVTTLMIFLAVLLLGAVSLRELSVDLLPNISYPRLSVVTQYDGVAPEEIETLVTVPLEAAVSRIPGLRRVESVSKEDVSYMTLEFTWGTDMDFAMLHAREKLDGVLLPEEVEEPTLIPLDPQSRPVMVLSISGERTLLELKEYAEDLLKPRLEQIEGIGSAEVAGGVEREIHVEIDPQRLALYSITIEEVSRRIDAFNRSLQGGTIRKGRFKYALRIVGEFEEIKEIEEITLKTTSGGGVIRLKDVARVRDSIKERKGITRLNGAESVGILVRKESGANTVKVSRKVREVLKELKAEDPNISLIVVSEQAKYIENAITSVLLSLVLGGMLAFLVLFLFLQDAKTPMIIAAVIPISVVATFNLIFFRGVTLNLMSLGGLALGVGMLVDNSIVVSESIFRHRSLGKSLSRAASAGTREVGMAVTASTFTTISVFLPVIYVHGVAGQLFKDQALTVTFALLSSLVVSLTLLPMLASRSFGASGERVLEREVLPKRKTARVSGWQKPYHVVRRLFYAIVKGILWLAGAIVSFMGQIFLLLVYYLSIPVRPLVKISFKAYNTIYLAFSSRYHRVLLWSLDHKGRVLAGSVFFMVVTLLAAGLIPRELMPKPEAVSFEMNMKTPIDYSLDQTVEMVAVIEGWLQRRPGVKTSFSQIGVVSGMEGLNPDVSLNSAKIFVEVHDASRLEHVSDGLRRFMRAFPEVSFSLLREQSTLTEFLTFAAAEVGLKIKGDDLEQLSLLAEDLTEVLKTVPGLTDITTNVGEGKPEFLVKISKPALERYDIAPAEIGDFMVNAVRGIVATQFRELEKKTDILVRLDEKTRDNIESILDEKLPYHGGAVPLRELVTYEIATGPKEIRRENQQREVLVSANLDGIKISQAAPSIREAIASLKLPANTRVVFSGEQEEMGKSFRSLIFAFSLAVLLVYMIMAAQFESLRHPLLILLTLPMGLTGAIWALLITGQTLNVISIIGMVVLAGIVVNDAIVKVDYTNKLRSRKGMACREAIMEASRVRLRPILMTTVTTILGLLPMSLGIGKGAELQQPLAIGVIGGLLLATFLTLILIPLVYEIFENKRS